MPVMLPIFSSPEVVLVQVDPRYCYIRVAHGASKPSSDSRGSLIVDANYFWGGFPIGVLADTSKVIRYYQLKNPRATLVFYKDHAEIIILSCREAEKEIQKGAQAVAQAGPTLVRNGKVCLKESHRRERFRKDVLRRTNHTAVGITKDNKLIFAFSYNKTLSELALIMRKHGALHAMAFDGGSSAYLLYNGKRWGCLRPKTCLILYPRTRSPGIKDGRKH